MNYNIAIIGSGYMARKHCDALMSRPTACLHTFCSTARSQLAAREMMADYGFRQSTTNYASVLANPEIDLIFICTPDGTHPQYVIAALQAGKHVFCEKPLARKEDDFQKIEKCLSVSGLVLQIGMNCRFREQYTIPQQIVNAGELGTLRFLRGTYVYNAVQGVRTGQKSWALKYPPEIFPFLHGGGIHCLDLLRWLGGPIKSVFARATAFELAEAYRADTFSVSLEFTSGTLGELLVAASAFRPNDFSLELWFSEGSLVGRKIFQREGDSVASQGNEIVVEQKVIDIGLQYEDMVRAIENRTLPLNSFDEAYANFLVLKGIERSITNKQPIEITN